MNFAHKIFIGLFIFQSSLATAQTFEKDSRNFLDKLRGYDYSLLAGPLHEPLQLQLQDVTGKIRNLSIERVKPAIRSAGMQVPAFEYRLLPDNIAYIALNTFGNDSAAKAFAEQYEEISRSQAIIFDVRNNGGGSTAVGWKILRYLINKPELINIFYTRDYKPTYRAWGRDHQPVLERTWLTPIN